MSDENEQGITEAEMIEAAEEVGLAVVPKVTIKKLSDMGVSAQGVGLTNVASGAVITTLAICVEMLQGVADVARKAKTAKGRIAATLAGAAISKSIQGCCQTVNAAGLAAPVVTVGPKKVLQIGAPTILKKTG